MISIHKNKIKLIVIACIWILVVIITIYNIRNDKLYFLYKPKWLDKSLNPVEKLYIDKNSKEPINLEYIEKIQKELPNVPFDFWLHYYEKPIKLKNNCTEYPYLFQLNFHNNYWQTFQNENVIFQLYAAYYDIRKNLPKDPVVRLLAMVNQKFEFGLPKTFCQLWFENSQEPIYAEVESFYPIYPKYWKIPLRNFYPYLITCAPLGESIHSIPRTISLVKPKHCGKAKNNLRIHFEKPFLKSTKQKFAVCVKGLNFPYTDNSVDIIEWLELLKILGVSKVYFYNYAIHANVSKVLNYYKKNGFVVVTPLTLSGGEPNFPNFQYAALAADQMIKRLNEYIPYNDCFYRNMYKYDYIAAIDIDEIIMPLGNLNSWQDILKYTENANNSNQSNCSHGYAGFCFLNAYFTDNKISTTSNYAEKDIPNYLYMLRHTTRLAQHSDINSATKCFHNTAEIHTLHNHFPLTWLKACSPATVEKNIVQLQHYRKVKNEIMTETLDNKFIIDQNIFRFKNDLIFNSQQVLRELRFLRV